MLKYLKANLSAPIFTMVCAASLGFAAPSAYAGDVAAGESVFKKCRACHAVGEGAKNKVGPQLNELLGRTAGSLAGYKYSNAMIAKGEEGLDWNVETLTGYLAAPKKYIKGTKMAFAGLKKDEDLENVIAYLTSFSAAAATEKAAEEAPAKAEEAVKAESDAKPVSTALTGERSKGKFGLGRLATKDEVAAWDIDIRPDGKGLPVGRGTVAEGEPIYAEACAACHGDFGEAVDRWPVLAGGLDTLQDDRPVKTIGSYWPYLSTVFDYVRRAMPFGNARSLSDDDVYALTAYLLYLNDIVEDEEFELSNDNFNTVEMPNAGQFIADNREAEPHYADKKEACMTDCKPGPVEITMHARVLDVTPDREDEGGGSSID
ncbi:MAG: c-type cytochrome [Salaquimonas sp.]